jgi:predicted nuclease with TOPRIM domain
MAMSDHVTNTVVDLLREQFARVHIKLDNLSAGQHDLSTRVTSLEAQVALLHGDFANQSMRIDRVDERLSRIERRLELADHIAR